MRAVAADVRVAGLAVATVLALACGPGNPSTASNASATPASTPSQKLPSPSPLASTTFSPSCSFPRPPLITILRRSGSVWGWGEGPHHQLENIPASHVPIQLPGLSKVIAVASGNTFNLALESDGTVLEWGYDSGPAPSPLTGLSTVVAISAGFKHSLALKADGTVWAWGDNYYGQLGAGNNKNPTAGVQQVSGLTMVTAVAAGTLHSLALRSDGTVWAWGFNNFGQLGTGNTTDSHAPVQVNGLSGIVGIAGGVYFSLALKCDGTVWAWGYNRDGELGNGNNAQSWVPQRVYNLRNVTAISSGDGFGLALESDGTVFTWGDNGYGQLGNGTMLASNLPVQVSGLTGVKSIAASSNSFHALAVKTDGSLWSWGDNHYGQLGDSTTADKSTPTQVAGLSSVIALSAGFFDSLAVK
jgi:alpha-tubulin suppressor-like RCC1 family protein